MQAAGKMLTQVPKEPWASVCADFIEPLPRSKHGSQMLLVIIDRFSKWKSCKFKGPTLGPEVLEHAANCITWNLQNHSFPEELR